MFGCSVPNALEALSSHLEEADLVADKGVYKSRGPVLRPRTTHFITWNLLSMTSKSMKIMESFRIKVSFYWSLASQRRRGSSQQK